MSICIMKISGIKNVVKKISLCSFVVLLCTVLLVTLNLCVVQTVQANKIVHNKYFSTEKIKMSDGTVFEKMIINGPPKPSTGFVRTVVSLPAPNSRAGINTISDVPIFTWVFGCSATSAAMIAGYYDRIGYPNMYTGPTNNGVMPLNNDDYWSTWIDSYGETRNRCPLSATQNGLDGRTQRGHVDDYWIGSDNPGPDPFVVNGWAEHTLGECTADYMGTNQASSPMENVDGATTFYSYPSGKKLTSAELFAAGPDTYKNSGLCGIQEFYESRGYSIVEAYNQPILPYKNNTQGFTFQQYKNEIDAKRPVMIHLEGHTIVGVGYNDSSNLVYIHDTWDHSQHSMSWGGYYDGMLQHSVSIVILESLNLKPTMVSPVQGSTLSGTSQLFSWTGNGVNVSNWQLYAGSSVGGYEYYDSGELSGSLSSITATNLPVDGSIIYVRLKYFSSGSWAFIDTSVYAGTVSNPLTVLLNASKTDGNAPLNVSFSCTVTGGKSPYTYAWDFNDNDTSTDATPSHIFADAGVYSVELVVTDDNSETNSTTKIITVYSGSGGCSATDIEDAKAVGRQQCIDDPASCGIIVGNPATLSLSNLDLYIPVINLDNINLWAEFKYVDGYLWELYDYGLNEQNESK